MKVPIGPKKAKIRLGAGFDEFAGTIIRLGV